MIENVALLRAVNALCVSRPMRRLLRTPALGKRTSGRALAEWEFRNAATALKPYGPHGDVAGKTVLDVGCGLGGKSSYLALHGARHVQAVDMDVERIGEARAFAREKRAGNILFGVADAEHLPFGDGEFDLVMFNDTLEHLHTPEASLREALRVLKRHGLVLLMFPPFKSPWGAHLFALIAVPWAHLVFDEAVLMQLWRERLVAQQRDAGAAYAAARHARQASAGTLCDITPLNRMTILGFKQMVAEMPFEMKHWRLHVPLPGLGFLARSFRAREYIVTRVVAVMAKP